MSLELYATFLAASAVFIIVPGPTATLIIANSLKYGARAGLENVAGTQIGLGIMIAIVGIGLATVMEVMGQWFDWLRLAGAAYLIWIGWKMLRDTGEGQGEDPAVAPRGGFLTQGCLVALSNPKMLLFFGAFFPQFMDPARDHATQLTLMGATAMVFAIISDSTYALASARAGRAFTRGRIRLLSRISGGILIGGGVWLALSRSR